MNVVKEWITPSGLKGFLIKNNFSINGYVKVPKDHPDYGKSYEDVDVDVHGGLTYSDEKGSFFGFDTQHSGDVWSAEDVPLLFHLDPSLTKKNWTIDLVVEETNNLAKQLAERGK